MSIYKTRPIGETFERRGVKLQVVENKPCNGCYFYGEDDCMNYRNDTGYCGECIREDHKNVIFKRIIENEL